MRFFADQLMFELLDQCDILIGAALIPGAHAPTLLTHKSVAHALNKE